MPKSKISQKVVEEMNRQFNQELSAAHSYLSLSVWCDVRNLKGFGKYFVKQAGEERAHAERILKHLTDRAKGPNENPIENAQSSRCRALDYLVDPRAAAGGVRAGARG